MPNKYDEVAKQIVGKWGYEEPYWWEPISKAIQKAVDETEKPLKDRIERAKDALTTIKKFDDGICGFGIDIGRAIKILEGKDVI